MKFTGERVVPNNTSDRIWSDHLERYLFSIQYINQKNVLDIACGTGYGCEILAKNGAKSVIGVDIDTESINYARENFQHEVISFKQGNISTFSSAKCFDVITCFETIEHISNYQVAMRNLHTLLRNKGRLIISSPNRPITSPEAKKISSKPHNEYHTQEFNKSEFIALLEENGFVVNRNNSVFGQRQIPPCDKSEVLDKIEWAKVHSSSKVTPLNGHPRYIVLVATKVE